MVSPSTVDVNAVSAWPSAAESPFDAAAGSELGRRLEGALASLSVEAREVLLLVGVEGMTPSEAAVICGVTPEAMRQRLKRASRQCMASEMSLPAR